MFEFDFELAGLPPFSYFAERPELSGLEFEDENSKAAFQKFTRGLYRGLFLSGINGCGKTHAGASIILRALEHKVSARRVLFSDAISKYTQNNWELPPVVIRPLFLFLDEVGKEDQKELGAQVLEKIIRHRIESGKYTIIATNLTIQAFIAKYGRTVESDLAGSYTAAMLSQKDRRRDKLRRI